VLYTGTEDPYNYVTVTVFDNSAKLEDPWKDIDAVKLLPGRDLTKDMEETVKSRDLVKSHLIIRNDEVIPDGGSGEVKYIEVDFMKVKPGNEGAYVSAEKKIWIPIQKEFIKAGQKGGCVFWG